MKAIQTIDLGIDSDVRIHFFYMLSDLLASSRRLSDCEECFANYSLNAFVLTLEVLKMEQNGKGLNRVINRLEGVA